MVGNVSTEQVDSTQAARRLEFFKAVAKTVFRKAGGVG
jgi:hypothetical protein